MDQFHQFFIQNQPLVPPAPGVSKLSKTAPANASRTDQGGSQVSFQDLLDQSVAGQDKLKFSAHAQERARQRNITLDERQMARLGEGVEKAAQKGSREALVLVDKIAAVVSVENRTVITVSDTGMLRDNVFTNIDSAVIS